MLTQRQTIPPRAWAGRPGRTLASLAAPMIRALHQVDSACMRALSTAVTDPQRAQARLEVSLWGPLRRALVAHIEDAHADIEHARIDVVLADHLLAFADDVLQWVADVEAGGERQLSRYQACCRGLCGQIAALGGDATPYRTRLQAIVLADPEAQIKSLCQLHDDLVRALETLCPRTDKVLLDDLRLPPPPL